MSVIRECLNLVRPSILVKHKIRNARPIYPSTINSLYFSTYNSCRFGKKKLLFIYMSMQPRRSYRSYPLSKTMPLQQLTSNNSSQHLKWDCFHTHILGFSSFVPQHYTEWVFWVALCWPKADNTRNWFLKSHVRQWPIIEFINVLLLCVLRSYHKSIIKIKNIKYSVIS